MAKKSPEINASSMADIAFLLLIFFLVTTTMSVDGGISRTLPPIVENTDDMKSLERNTLQVQVSGSDAILVAGQRVDLRGVNEVAKEFLTNPTNDPNLPEIEMTDIQYLGQFPVSKGIISLKSNVSTSYDVYLAVQNELSRAVNEVRDEVSERFFNKKFSELDETRKKSLITAIPQKISEAEPVDLTKGGKK